MKELSGWGGLVQFLRAVVSFLSLLQTQLPQQMLQLQEARAHKEKSVAVLEHQLTEVEVRCPQSPR